MSKKHKMLSFFTKRRGLSTLFFLIAVGLTGILPPFKAEAPFAEADFKVLFNQNPEFSQFSVIQGNTLSPISNPDLPQDNPVVIERIEVIVTAYSSSPWETDGDPHLTAAGTLVREGIVANNLLPFGTKIRLPEIFGNRIFVVEDRMNPRKGNYQIDIWFPSYWEALNFGSKKTIMEIIED